MPVFNQLKCYRRGSPLPGDIYDEPSGRWEYMNTVYEQCYQAEGRAAKGLILNEFCKTYRCHRKHALRLLNSPPSEDERPPRRPRGSAYDKGRVLAILEALWAPL